MLHSVAVFLRRRRRSNSHVSSFIARTPGPSRVPNIKALRELPNSHPKFLRSTRAATRATAWLLAWFCHVDDAGRKLGSSPAMFEMFWRACAIHMRRTLAEDNVIPFLACAIDACEKYASIDSDGSLAALRNDAFSFLLEAFMPVSRRSASTAELARGVLRKYAIQVLDAGGSAS